MAKFVISGISGFLGKKLASKLYELGHKVYGIGFRRDEEELRKAWPKEIVSEDSVNLPRSLIHYEEVDICDALALCEYVNCVKPNFIYHLAAQANIPHARRNPASTYRTNILGSHNILNAAAITPSVKGIHLASSSDVYGSVSEECQPIKESYPLLGCNPYSISKIAMEKIGQLIWHEIDDMTIIVTRLFTTIGPGQYLDSAISYFAWQIVKIKKGLEDPTFRCGNIDNYRSFLDVDDVINAFLKLPAIWRGKSFSDTVFNITGTEVISMRTIVEYLVHLADVEVIISQEGRSIDITRQVGDGSKFHEKTGWQPSLNPLEAAERVFNYWMGKL